MLLPTIIIIYLPSSSTHLIHSLTISLPDHNHQPTIPIATPSPLTLGIDPSAPQHPREQRKVLSFDGCGPFLRAVVELIKEGVNRPMFLHCLKLAAASTGLDGCGQENDKSDSFPSCKKTIHTQNQALLPFVYSAQATGLVICLISMHVGLSHPHFTCCNRFLARRRRTRKRRRSGLRTKPECHLQ